MSLWDISPEGSVLSLGTEVSPPAARDVVQNSHLGLTVPWPRRRSPLRGGSVPRRQRSRAKQQGAPTNTTQSQGRARASRN